MSQVLLTFHQTMSGEFMNKEVSILKTGFLFSLIAVVIFHLLLLCWTYIRSFLLLLHTNTNGNWTTVWRKSWPIGEKLPEENGNSGKMHRKILEKKTFTFIKWLTLARSCVLTERRQYNLLPGVATSRSPNSFWNISTADLKQMRRKLKYVIIVLKAKIKMVDMSINKNLP